MSRSLLSFVFILYVILVSYFCLSPPEGINNIGSLDKIAHVLTYIGFAILGCLMAKNRKQLLIIITACAIYGLAIEYLQSLTGYRTASVHDELANIIGLFIGVTIAKIIDHFRPLPAFKKRQ
jgi:VanZ family protein